MTKGKVCIVTGANSGIGKATALGLAGMGATVVMLCRSRERGEAALAEIRDATGSDRVELMLADLSAQGSIRAFVDGFRRRYDRLHVLVNNAGVTSFERVITQDGVELTLAVNYLAPFLLTNLLLDLLRESAPARVVNLAGMYHKKGAINLDDLQLEQGYDFGAANSQSQLARVLFTFELARRLAGTGVTANCVHPGAVRTNAQQILPWYLRLMIATIMRPVFVSPERGARPVLHLAASSEVEGVSGRYFERMKEAEPSPLSRDEALAGRLWEASERLVGLHGAG